jgi:hypothetical protein
LLGVVTEDSESFFARFPERVTVEPVKHLISVLYKEFGNSLIVVSDGTLYFRTSAITDLAASDSLAFVRLPAYRPDLTPVEECRKPLEAVLGNCHFKSVNRLTETIDATLDQLIPPE